MHKTKIVAATIRLIIELAFGIKWRHVVFSTKQIDPDIKAGQCIFSESSSKTVEIWSLNLDSKNMEKFSDMKEEILSFDVSESKEGETLSQYLQRKGEEKEFHLLVVVEELDFQGNLSWNYTAYKSESYYKYVKNLRKNHLEIWKKWTDLSESFS